MTELFKEIFLYAYLFNIVIALISYGSQQKILLDMIRGKRPLSRDVSGVQYWIWSGANFVTAAYSIINVQIDLPFILLSSVNFLNSFLTALLNSYVHYLCNKRNDYED